VSVKARSFPGRSEHSPLETTCVPLVWEGGFRSQSALQLISLPPHLMLVCTSPCRALEVSRWRGGRTLVGLGQMLRPALFETA